MGVPRPAELLRCEDALAHLGLLADGELRDDDEMSELRGHVAVCPSCEQSWRRLIDGKRLLQAAAAVRADDEPCPPAVLSDVMAFIDADVGRERAVNARRIGLAVVVVVVVAVVCLRGF